MILDLPFILETRRNHALEHATLHVLARKYPNQHMAGHSNPTGFFVIGKFDTQEIWTAATEAMTRLRGQTGNPRGLWNQHCHHHASRGSFCLAAASRS
jgi:hypothetical protein